VQTDWPTARFVPEGTGHNPHETMLSPTTVGDLELAWSIEAQGPLNTTPIVVDGVVYVAGHVTGTGGSEVSAYDAATGEELWTTKDAGLPPSDLAVADGKLYVSFLTDHVLRAYYAATGELLWEVPGPTGAPTVVGGVVYAADQTRSLWAINAETGRKMWAAHAPGGYGFGLAVANERVYVGGDEDNAPVFAYNASTGALVWRTKTSGENDSTPAVANGMAYVGSDIFYAFDARTGRVRWSADTGGGEVAPAAVANGNVYVGSSDSNVYAFDALTGEELWVAPTGGSITDSQATIVANGVVYVGSIDDSVYAFDAETGEQLWSYQTGSNARKQSVVVGTLYVTSFNTHLYAFRLPG
jgi:outer membrane protein assembly factor BamB